MLNYENITQPSKEITFQLSDVILFFPPSEKRGESGKINPPDQINGNID